MAEQEVQNKQLMTAAGAKRLEEELEERTVIRRAEISQKIKIAREQGDLSENAEYDAARDEQRDNEARIAEIEAILQNVEIVAGDENDGKTVNVGCTVYVRDLTYEEDVVFHIVGSNEVDSLRGRISNESPVGKALMGKKTGNKVTVETPGGEVQYKIRKIRISEEE